MFFEQDSYSFGRFLPGFLLPGPLLYNPRTDSFLTVSSARQLESYKWVLMRRRGNTPSASVTTRQCTKETLSSTFRLLPVATSRFLGLKVDL